MVHLYCGDGKGKTTAAMGLALRTAGRGGRVLVAQFCKGADSGERFALEQLPGVELLPVPERVKFTFALAPEERAAERERYAGMLEEAGAALRREAFALLVLDEVCAALNVGLLELGPVLSLLDLCAERGTEAVLTGRDPCAALLERADYISCVTKQRHPFDRGIRARRGIEF